MAKNEDTDKLNYSILESLNKLISRTKATHNRCEVSKASTDDAHLLNYVCMYERARVQTCGLLKVLLMALWA